MEQNQELPGNNTTQSQPVSQKPYNLESNVEAALSYLITPLTGVAVFIFEKSNKFVRFHAFQSILLGVVWLGLNFASTMLTFLLIGFILVPIINIACFVAWLLCMWKAYNKEEFELPIIGKIARSQVNK